MSSSSSSKKQSSSWIRRLLCCGRTAKSSGRRLHRDSAEAVANSHAASGNDELGSIVSAELMDEIVKAFMACDINGDGFISAEELRSLLLRFNRNQSDNHISAIIKSVDFDHDGRVSFDEFKMVFGRMYKAKNDPDNVKSAFKVFDHDNDGYITLPEIKLAMSYMGEVVDDKQAQQMLDMADANKDGKVSEDEFVSILGSITNQVQTGAQDNPQPPQ